MLCVYIIHIYILYIIWLYVIYIMALYMYVYIYTYIHFTIYYISAVLRVVFETGTYIYPVELNGPYYLGAHTDSKIVKYVWV